MACQKAIAEQNIDPVVEVITNIAQRVGNIRELATQNAEAADRMAQAMEQPGAATIGPKKAVDRYPVSVLKQPGIDA